MAMDRRQNEFRRGKRFDDDRRDRFKGFVEDARRKSRGDVADFRDRLRRGMPGEVSQGKNTQARADADKGFTEDFHERQVDYSKKILGGEDR